MTEVKAIQTEDTTSLYKQYHQSTGRMASMAMQREVESGRLMGPPPLGYCNVAGTIEVDADVAPLVTRAFQLMALPGTSFRSVQRELQKAGMVSKRGGPIAISTLHRMLINPFYAGLIRYKGKLYPGNHQPLVSLQLFQKVQAKTDRKQNGTLHT